MIKKRRYILNKIVSKIVFGAGIILISMLAVPIGFLIILIFLVWTCMDFLIRKFNIK